MCDASSFGSAGGGGMSSWFGMASSLVSAFGNLSEGAQGQKFYNYKADQAIADAAYERGAATVRAGKIRKAGMIQQSQVKAAYAGSGIDVTQGTPLVSAETLQRNISEDATAQLLTGERKAKVLESEAAGYRAAGENAKSGGIISAGRSILSGAAAGMDAETKKDKWIRKSASEFQARKRAEFALGGGFEDAGM